MDRPLKIALVAPSMAILGGQAVQAARLLEAWDDDPDIRRVARADQPGPAAPPAAQRSPCEYVRTAITQLSYWPLLFRELRHADVVHVFSASYWSFLLAPLPAVLVARLLGKPVVMNYRSGEAPDHLEALGASRAPSLRHVDRNIVPSRLPARRLRAVSASSSEIIPNIVDVERVPRSASGRRCVRSCCPTRNFESLYNLPCTLARVPTGSRTATPTRR